MAVHFDFILDDADAENLMQWVAMERNHCNSEALHAYALHNKKLAKAYKASAKYVEEVMRKMKNTRA
jgi:hypothetical protein